MNPRHSTTTMTLRNTDVRVEYRIAPAEPDVGLPEPYVDESVVYDLDGRLLDWDLTGDEERYVAEQCLDAARSWAEPDDPYDGLSERYRA